VSQSNDGDSPLTGVIVLDDNVVGAFRRVLESVVKKCSGDWAAVAQLSPKEVMAHARAEIKPKTFGNLCSLAKIAPEKVHQYLTGTPRPLVPTRRGEAPSSSASAAAAEAEAPGASANVTNVGGAEAAFHGVRINHF